LQTPKVHYAGWLETCWRPACHVTLPKVPHASKSEELFVRHVVIALSCPRQVFQPKKVASWSQIPTNLSETCSPARASKQVSDQLA